MVAILVVLLAVLISGAVLTVRLGFEEMKDDKRGAGSPPTERRQPNHPTAR